MDNDCESVFNAVAIIKSVPSVLEYEGLCKLLAENCFISGKELDGVYYLSETHSVSLRHKIEHKNNALLRKSVMNELAAQNSPECSNTEELSIPMVIKRAIGFDGPYSKSKGQGLLARIKKLPKEWTIVQVTAACDLKFDINPEEHRFTCPPRIYVSRMECGPDEPCIMSACVDLEPNTLRNSSMFHAAQYRTKIQDGTKSFLEELRDIILDNKNVNKNPKGFKRVRDYWARRAEHNERMKMLLSSIESHWLRGWKCMFLGKLANSDDKKTIEEIVDRVISSPGVPSNLPQRSRAILSLIIGSYPCISLTELQFLLKDILPNPNKKMLEAFTKALQDEFSKHPTNSVPMWQRERHPVILILDKRIECVPWEILPMLRNHPISRVPSIHFVQSLSIDKATCSFNDMEICAISKEADVDSSQAYYLVNPDGSLPDTEKRILQYLERRPEIWRGKGGAEPTVEEFMKEVGDSNILLYSGHGSGKKFVPYVLSNQNRTVSLLMGCKSVTTYRIGANLDAWGTVYEYMLARSPCVVGMLWEVTDLECDLVTMKLFDSWLGPPPNDKESLATKNVAASSGKGSKNESSSNSSDELVSFNAHGKLLRAILDARGAAKQFMTSAALVSYGIPIQASKKDKL